MFENTSLVTMYAVTPCHAGSGSSTGVVDLPIQRERHTNYPVIQSSGVKGAFRANFRDFKETKINADSSLKDKDPQQFKELESLIFGAKSDSDEVYAGALSVTDAKIFAFPMRSTVAPFVWITCPAVLKRFALDLDVAKNGKFNVPDLAKLDEPYKFSDEAEKNKVVGKAFSIGSKPIPEKKVLLEDFAVSVEDDQLGLKNIYANLIESFKLFDKAERLLLVSDEVFSYGVGCCPINAQITIDSETGTSKEGLRYQEDLPADSIMYSVIHWGNPHKVVEKKRITLNATVRDYVETVISDYIQIAGDETCGRGIFEIKWTDFGKVN